MRRRLSRLKQHYPWEKPGMAFFTLVLLEFGDFPMMRRVLKRIKVRAERMSARQAMPPRFPRKHILTCCIELSATAYPRPGTTLAEVLEAR
jgi:hypothetical protein